MDSWIVSGRLVNHLASVGPTPQRRTLLSTCISLALPCMTKVKALLVDLSGTLHVGDEATPGALEALKKLRAAGVPIRFCSNTTKDGSQALQDRLKRIGFDIDKDEIFTSLSAVKLLVEQRKLRPLLLLSDSALQDFADTPTNDPNAVIVGLAPDKLDYSNLNAAFRVLTRDSPEEAGKPALIATHRALYFRDADQGLSLGPGGFIIALEQACDIKAEVVGKPTRAFFKVCLRSLEEQGIHESDWPNVAMVGDDYRNDLGGGVQDLHLRRYLVRTGKYREGDEARLEEGSAACFDSFADAVDAILGGEGKQAAE